MTKDKNIRKIFIEETLGTRKYLSYRADLIMYKLLLCIFVFFVIAFISSDLILSLLIVTQVFIIFTLINKLNINRKLKEGEALAIKKIKKEYVTKKLKEIDIESYENLIKFFFEEEGYLNLKRIGKYVYSVDLDDITYCIKMFNMYEGAQVEKLDIRSFAGTMSKNKIKNGYIVTANELSEESIEIINDLKDNLNIVIVDLDLIIEKLEKYKILPEKKFFYKKISELKYTEKSKKIIKNNTFNSKKIIIYIFAAAFFYINSRLLPYNSVSLFISFYFLLLAIISFVYYLIDKYKLVKNLQSTSISSGDN